MLVPGGLLLSLEKRKNLEDEDVVVAAIPEKSRLKPPSRYGVIVLNDDFTTMDFVIEVLERFFRMSREKATQTMLEIHTKGQAVCGIYSRDIAETKARMVNSHAREYGHPLLCKTGKMD